MRTVDFVRAVELAKQGADVRPVSNPDRKLVVTEVGEHPMLRSVKHPTLLSVAPQYTHIIQPWEVHQEPETRIRRAGDPARQNAGWLLMLKNSHLLKESAPVYHNALQAGAEALEALAEMQEIPDAPTTP